MTEKRAPLMPEEFFRVKALNALLPLQPLPEQRFNQYVELAAAYFDVPFALFSLITLDRQWIVASHGTTMEWVERRFSICDHAIRSNDMLLVRDLREDVRFAKNPFVIGTPFLRSYAGTPLVLNSGYRIGTVCLLDTRVRDFSQSQCKTLAALGKLILSELDSKGGFAKDAGTASATLSRKQRIQDD